MPEAFLDTDVIIRLVTGDDPAKQADTLALFERVEAGELRLRAPVTVMADAVYVLSSRRLYNLPRVEVRAILDRVLQVRNLEVDEASAISDALQLYATTNLDFGDAFIVSSMRRRNCSRLYSYDRDFERIAGVVRVGP